MVTNIQPSLTNIFSYPSGATGPKLIILWPYKKIIVLVSIISTFVEVVYLSWLNCFLLDGYLDILESCIFSLMV